MQSKSTRGPTDLARRRRVPVFRVAPRATQSGRWLHGRLPVSRDRIRTRATAPSTRPLDLNPNLDLNPDLDLNRSAARSQRKRWIPIERFDSHALT